MHEFILGIRNYANFEGRSTRREYWMYVFYYVLILSILYLINYYNGNNIFIGLFQIILIIPTLSILVRRLHDVNKSGWLILFSFFPLFNLYLLYLLVQPSSNDSKYNNR